MSAPAHPKPSPDRSQATLAGWLLLTYSASATVVFVSTDDWYAGLAKPTWNPPGWIFGHSGDDAELLAGEPDCLPPIALLRCVGNLRQRAQRSDLADELRAQTLRTG